MRTTTRSGGAESAPSVNRVRVQGAAMRFDGQKAADNQDGFSRDAYTLLDAAGRRVVVVMPESKQYMEIKFDDSTTQALMFAVAAQPTSVTDIKVRGAALGSGGVVGGMPTRHFRLTTDYTYLRSESEGAARKGTTHVVEDYWVSDRLKDVSDPLEQLGRMLGPRGGFGASPFASLGGTSVGQLLERRSAEQRRLFRGLPVRTVTTTTDVDPDGKRTESTTTTEISDVSTGDLDPALFRVPEGFAKFDIKQLLNVGAQMRAALGARTNAAGQKTDSAGNIIGETVDAAKEGAKEGAKEAAREGAREAAGRKIRGIFKKP